MSSSKDNKPRIITFTLNAAVDKRYIMDNVRLGTVMRVKKCDSSAGGKGINVARVLHRLGANVCASGIIGGYAGRFIVDTLAKDGIPNNFYSIAAETRSCINVIDESNASQTEFLEAGGLISNEERAGFFEYFASTIRGASIVTLSGSVVKGFDSDIYTTLIKICKNANIKVILDTSGELLKNGLDALPFAVKPNIDEIGQLLDNNSFDELDVIHFAREKVAEGVDRFVLSLGARGSICVTKSGVFKVVPQKIKPVNTVGCGDALTAGLAYAESLGYNEIKALEFATRVATASALCPRTGDVDPLAIEHIVVKTDVL